MEAAKKTLELEIRLAAQSASAQLRQFSQNIRDTADKARTFSSGGRSVSDIIRRVNAESARAAQSLKLFGTSSGGAAQLQHKLRAAALDLTDRGLAPESAEVQKLVDQYKALEEESRIAASGQNGLASGLSKVKGELMQLAPVVAGLAFDKKLAGMAGFALSVSDTFRGVREDFGIMLGDMAAGAGLFDELQEFNFWTPFDLEETAQAAKVLRTAKIELSDLTTYLTRFGDLSQGNNQKFQSFISAFSKASAKGKADMEVLNIYIDQGVQILDALASQMGVTSAEITKMASDGKISFADLDAAIAAMTAEGGQYYGTLAAASQRLDAVQAGLQESVKSLAASFGDMLAPAVASALTGMTNLVDAINSSPLAKGVLLGAVAALAAAINVKMVAALVSLATRMWASYAATMAQATAMSTLNPVMIAAVAAAGVATAAYVAYAAAQQKAAEETNAAALAAQKQKEALAGITAELKNASEEQLRFNTAQLERELADVSRQLDEIYEKQRRYESGDFTGLEFKAPNGNLSEIEDSSGLSARVAELEERMRTLTDIVKTYKSEMSSREIADAMETANKALEHRDELYKKTVEYQRTQLEQELEFARSLYELQTRNEDGTYSGFDRAKTDAIIRHLEQQIDGLNRKGKEAADWTTEWADKFMTAEEKIRRDWDKAAEDLRKKGKNVFGEGFVDRPEYQSELEYLNRHFEEQMDRMRREGKVGVTFSASVGQAAQSAISGTDLGDLIQMLSNGTSVFGALLSLVIRAVASLDSFQEAMNFVQTIIKKVFASLENMMEDTVDLVDGILSEIAEVLKPLFAIILAISNEFTKIVSSFLQPIISVLKEVFNILIDIWNDLLVPLSKGIAWVLNYVIKFINKVFGTNIKTLEGFKKITILTEEQIRLMEEAQEEMRSKYDKLISAIDDTLSRQISSLQTQYELGLITRESYDKQAAAYTEAAEKEKDRLEKEKIDKLDEIKENTYNTAEQLASITGRENNYDSNEKSPLTFIDNVGTGGALTDIKKGDYKAAAIDTGLQLATGGLYGLGKALGKAFGWWDVGSSNIPQDQFGMVHKGETIIPRTFADGIRSGELALVGGGSSGAAGGTSVYVSVNVDGSVVSERELVDAVYEGISRGIRSGEKTPLPAA